MAGTAGGPEQSSSTPFSDSEDRPCSNCFYHVLCINKIKSNQADICPAKVQSSPRAKERSKASAPTPFERPKEEKKHSIYILPFFLMFIVAEFGETMEKEQY